MAVLNAILAKLYPAPLPAAGDVPGSSRAVPPQSSPGGEKDLLLLGRHWQNRAAGEQGSLAGSDCRCGSCAGCAAKAYGSQNKSLSFSLAAAGEQDGDGTAAAGGATATGAAADGEEQAADSAQAAPAGGLPVKGLDGEPLNPADVAQLAELKKADAAVRAHEQAHLAAAGGLAKGGASFTYRQGPDGRNYAVGGEVQIDTSKGATPEETVAKMVRVRAAALAPANPSPQDRKVAQTASVTMSEARLELNTQGTRPEEQQETTEQGAAVEKVEGEAGDHPSAAATGRRKSAVTARAASRYLSAARGSVGFHLAV